MHTGFDVLLLPHHPCFRFERQQPGFVPVHKLVAIREFKETATRALAQPNSAVGGSLTRGQHSSATWQIIAGDCYVISS